MEGRAAAAAIAELTQKRQSHPIQTTPLVQKAHRRWGEDRLALLRKITAHFPPTELATHTGAELLSYVLQREYADAISSYLKHSV
jgi:hypothetical protein